MIDVGIHQSSLVERSKENHSLQDPLRRSESGCPSSPEAVVASISRVVLGIQPIRQSIISTGSFSADFPLAGSGEALATCGSFFTVGCLNVDKHQGTNLDGVNMEGKAVLERRKMSCYRALCPICRDDWISREVDRAVQRLGAFSLKGRVLKPIHVIVSVPRSDYGLDFNLMRKRAYAILRRVHCLGGVMMYHPKREDRHGHWYFSPHFHAVGYGWIVDVRATYVHSGYIIKNVGVRKSVAGTLFYQLSHCGVSPKHHAVTWFGALSYRKLHVKYREPKDCRCPLCTGKLRRLMWVGDGCCPLPDVEGVLFFDDADNWVRLKGEPYDGG
jgi:hypothetical protein